MTDLTTEFFYDGIARIIPGLVVIALYGRHIVMMALKDFQDASVVVGFCVFFAAWVIGVIIDILTFHPFVCLLKVAPRCNLIQRLQLHLLSDYDHKSMKELEFRRQVYKAFSEKIMFRSLSAISLITFIWTPADFWTIKWNAFYSAFGAIVFGAAWLLWGFSCPRNKTTPVLPANPLQPPTE
jgi:hypothetical protein